jgi:single-strand DNA-binding protein
MNKRDSINRVILLGIVAERPRISEKDGTPFVANFPIATSETFRDKEGEEVERTQWHRIVCWGKLSGIAKNYVKSGDYLYIEGKIVTNNWTDREDNTHTSAEIVAVDFLFLSKEAEIK